MAQENEDKRRNVYNNTVLNYSALFCCTCLFSCFPFSCTVVTLKYYVPTHSYQAKAEYHEGRAGDKA